MIRLVHLSDIHFAGYGNGWDPHGDQRTELLRDLGRLVLEDGRVHGVLVGGDIAFKAASDEYVTATNWLKSVCEKGECDSSSVWVVPGNHDIDRNSHKRIQARTPFLTEVRAAANDKVDAVLHKWLAEDPASAGLLRCFDEYNNFAEQFGCATSSAEPHWNDTTLDVDGHVLRITGINSVVASDSSDCIDGNPTLVLGRRQCEIPCDAGHIRIAFAHHPPSWVKDWASVEPYLLRAHVLLFGHEHLYRASQFAPVKR